MPDQGIRRWEHIIPFEDRAEAYSTNRWRLIGIRTKADNQNTDGGVLWLVCSKSGDTVTATLYKDDACASANAVAAGTVDASGVDAEPENDAEVALTASNDSGISGSFWLHDWQGTSELTSPIQVALCTDEEIELLHKPLEDLPGYNVTSGLADFIRAAGEQILGRVMHLFATELGGYGVAPAWYILEASRAYPDLRKLANPQQLRWACAHLALSMAFGQGHLRSTSSAYSAGAERHRELYEAEMAGLALAFKPGSGDTPDHSGHTAVIHQRRA